MIFTIVFAVFFVGIFALIIYGFVRGAPRPKMASGSGSNWAHL
ncbi:MAG: hypothetical protein ACI91O_000709 [Candidatus Poriferisodalaceae bacterium]|jgi:hypothetical protein